MEMLPLDGFPTRARRAWRGIGAGSLTVLVALAGHTVGGGRLPPTILLVTTLVLSWLPGIALVGRRSSLWRQIALVTVTQGVLHLLFLVEADSAGSLAGPVAPVAGSMPGMTMAPGTAATATVLDGAMAGMSMPGWLMWSGHALAAIVTVVAWRRAESAWRSAVAAVQHIVVTALHVLVATPPRAPRANAARFAGPIRSGGRDIAVSIRRRGPPLAAS